MSGGQARKKTMIEEFVLLDLKHTCFGCNFVFSFVLSPTHLIQIVIELRCRKPQDVILIVLLREVEKLI